MTAVLAYDDKIELLVRLQSKDEYGAKVLKAAITSDTTTDFLNDCIVPFLRLLGSDVYCSSLLKSNLSVLIRTLQSIPGLVLKFHDAIEQGLCLQELPVAFFTLMCCRDIDSAREEGSPCHQLAQLFIRKDSPVARSLKNLLGFTESDPAATSIDGLGLEDIKAQAGGRHNNDHADFRRIQIMPTIEELMSEEYPYLPNFNPAESAVLDRQFRLLR